MSQSKMLSDAASIKSASTDYAEGIVQKLRDVTPLQDDPSKVTDVRKILTHSYPSACSSQPSSSADPFPHISVQWGDNVRDLLGYDVRIPGDIETPLQWWLQRVHPDERPGISAQLQAHFGAHPDWASAEARLCYLEYRIQRKDGSWLYVGDRITTCRDTFTGLPTVSESFCFDHSARFGGALGPERQSEDLGEDNFKMVAQNMHSGLFMMNAHGYVTFMNAAAERLTGFKFDDISKITFHEAVHSLYPDGSAYPIHECPVYGHQVHNESVQEAEEIFIDRNGRFFDIRYSVAPLRGGYQYGAVIEFRDVSEEKRRERQRLTAMMDSEHQAARVKQEEIMREHVSNFVDFVAHEVRNPLHGITANGSFLLEALEQLETLYLAASQNNTPVSSRAPSPTRSPTTFGSPTSPFGKSKARQTAAEVFTSARAYLRAIDECAAHQSHILNNLLDLSRLAAGKVQLLEEAFSPWDTTEQAMRMVSAKAAERGVTFALETRTERIKNVLLNGDETSLRQVLLNLLGNATKFANEGGKVTVRLDIETSPDGDPRSLLTGSVEDQGVGMTDKEMSLLFERFGQANRKVSNVYGGSGLGLAISRQLVRLMDGDITVTSKKGVGSTFRFTALLQESKAEDKAKWLDNHLASRLQYMGNGHQKQTLRMKGDSVTAIETTGRIQSARGQPAAQYRNVAHILAAEDNKINQTILGKYLKAIPKVKLVNDGKEAYEYFLSEEGKSLDLIIMDVMMPVWGGVEATKRIREYEAGQTVLTKRKRIPIIGLSGNARTEQAEEAKTAGMDDYLCKPCSKKMLEDMLVKWDDLLDGEEAQR